MKKIVLACLAIVIPLGAAYAENWQNKVMKPSTSRTIRGSVACLSSANCWCNSKHKTLLPGRVLLVRLDVRRAQIRSTGQGRGVLSVTSPSWRANDPGERQ